MFFFFNATAPTEIYTLSLHDALPISEVANAPFAATVPQKWAMYKQNLALPNLRDRKSTRLNSSHVEISYAVFCLKKKKKRQAQKPKLSRRRLRCEACGDQLSHRSKMF